MRIKLVPVSRDEPERSSSSESKRNKSGTSSLFEVTGVKKRKDRALQREKLCGPKTPTSPCLDMSPQQRMDLQMQLLKKSYFSLHAQC